MLWVVEFWKEKVADVSYIQCGFVEHRTLVAHNSLNKSAQYLRSSFNLVWRVRSTDSESKRVDCGEVRGKRKWAATQKMRSRKKWILWCEPQRRPSICESFWRCNIREKSLYWDELQNHSWRRWWFRRPNPCMQRIHTSSWKFRLQNLCNDSRTNYKWTSSSSSYHTISWHQRNWNSDSFHDNERSKILGGFLPSLKPLHLPRLLNILNFFFFSCGHFLSNRKQSVMSKRVQESTAKECSAVAKPRLMNLVSRNLLSALETPPQDSSASNSPGNQELDQSYVSPGVRTLMRNSNQDPTAYSQERRQDDTIFEHRDTGTEWKLSRTFQSKGQGGNSTRCKYSQFQHLTECSRQHISSTTSKTHDFKTTPATNGWRFPLMPPWSSRHADIVKVNDTIVELDLLKNTKSSNKYKITIDESAETVEKAKTTINDIVMYYHDEVTYRTKCTKNALYRYLASEMKHIHSPISHEAHWEAHWWRGWWKDPGDRRWRHTVLWADRGRPSSSDRRKNRGSCDNIPRERIPERVIAQTVNMSGHTYKWWRRSSNILNLPFQVANAQDAKIVSRHDPAVNQWTSRKLSGGEAVQDHQEHSAEKESDRPAEDQPCEPSRVNSIQIQHIWQVSCCAKYHTKPRSSRQCRIRSLDPTTIRQARINQINQFDKHVEVLEEQYINEEIDVPVMLPGKPWRCQWWSNTSSHDSEDAEDGWNLTSSIYRQGGWYLWDHAEQR